MKIDLTYSDYLKMSEEKNYLKYVLQAFLKLLDYSDKQAKGLIEKSIINSEKIYVEVLRSYHYLNGSNR